MEKVLTWTALVGGAALGVIILRRILTGSKHKLPLGPRGVPFFGNVFQIDPQCPHGTITEWSDKYGDVMKIKLFGDDYVVLSSFEAIYEGLVKKANDFAGRPYFFRMQVIQLHCEEVAFTSYSPKWAFLKKTMLQSLKMYGDNLENLELITLDLIKDMNKELWAEAEEKEGIVDMYPTMHQCVTGIMTSILYGHKVSREKSESLINVTQKGQKIIETTSLHALLDVYPSLRHVLRGTYRKLLEIAHETEGWFKQEIDSRRKSREPGNPLCFLDEVLDQQEKCKECKDGFQITDDNVYGLSTNLIFAGTITTSVSLKALIAVLVNKQELQKKMADAILMEIGKREPRLKDRASLGYIEAAILELLRYSSIVPLNILHYTTRDTSITGFHIPKDTRVMFNLWKLHHNPQYWDEPFEFRPERFLDADGKVLPPDHMNRKMLLPFGASRRVCVGEALAKNRLFLMVTSLLQHYEFHSAGAGRAPQHDPRDYATGFATMPKDYCVKLVPRS